MKFRIYNGPIISEWYYWKGQYRGMKIRVLKMAKTWENVYLKPKMGGSGGSRLRLRFRFHPGILTPTPTPLKNKDTAPIPVPTPAILTPIPVPIPVT